jgi:hypothetical protein
MCPVFQKIGNLVLAVSYNVSHVPEEPPVAVRMIYFNLYFILTLCFNKESNCFSLDSGFFINSFQESTPSLPADLQLINADPVYPGSAAILNTTLQLGPGYNRVNFSLSCTGKKISRRLCTESVFVHVFGAQESIPPACVTWRTSTTNRVVVPAREAGNRFLGSLKAVVSKSRPNT